MRRSIISNFLAIMLLGMGSGGFVLGDDMSALQRTYRELRRYALPDESASEDRDIPLRIRLLQTRFKHQLRDLIVETLNQDVTSIGRPTSEIRTRIQARFKALRLITRAKEYLPFFSFGHVLDVSISRPREHADFLAVGVVIDASWDQDESLYIFQHQSSGWVNILAAEVNDYVQVWRAQSSRFSYAISASALDGSWFVVTASINPHMVSAWQHVTYTALAAGRDADHPKILVRRTHNIYLGGPEDESHACKIQIAKSGFRVRFMMGFWDDGPVPEWYSDKYTIRNGVVRRTTVRCRTRDSMGRRISCPTRDTDNYLERVEKAYEPIRKQVAQ